MEFSPEFLARYGFSKAVHKNRMSWIKTSLLWMLHRADWGNKEGQEMLVQINVPKDYLFSLCAQAIKSTMTSGKDLVIYQTDPDRLIIGRRWQQGRDYLVKITLQTKSDMF